MKFICNQQTLAKALNTVSKAVSNRTTIPILKGIQLPVIQHNGERFFDRRPGNAVQVVRKLFIPEQVIYVDKNHLRILFLVYLFQIAVGFRRSLGRLSPAEGCYTAQFPELCRNQTAVYIAVADGQYVDAFLLLGKNA